jgi:hypothetical protein
MQCFFQHLYLVVIGTLRHRGAPYVRVDRSLAQTPS